MTDVSCFAFADRACNYDGDSYRLSRYPLGSLTITSGAVLACDPFVDLESKLQFPAPNGTFTTVVTIAHITEDDDPHLRVAYLSLIFDHPPPRALPMLRRLVSTLMTPMTMALFCVDSGTVAFVDAHAAKHFATRVEASGLELIDDIFDSDQPDSWFNLMDSPDHYREGCANITLPFLSDKQNIVLSISGWGDGHLPDTMQRATWLATTSTLRSLRLPSAPIRGTTLQPAPKNILPTCQKRGQDAC